MLPRLQWSLLLLSLAGCASGGSGAAASAIINTAVATGVAGARRAGGDCYTACPPATTCNEKTGYCDPLPCRGECQQGQRCDESSVFPRCVSDVDPTAGIARPAPEPTSALGSDLPRALPAPEPNSGK